MTKSFVVTGRVQGVGFRQHVAMLAEQLKIDGEVWNRLDGAVECLAAHADEEVLFAFEQGLWNGPGRVAGVEGVEIPGARVEAGFRVGPTRP